MFHVGPVSMFITHFTKSHFLISNALLVIAIKVEAKCKLRELLLYILQKITLAKATYF
jgi:hypothetical protein